MQGPRTTPTAWVIQGIEAAQMIRKGRVLGITRHNPQGQDWQATLDVTVVLFNPVITVSSSPLPATVVQVTFRLHVSDGRGIAAQTVSGENAGVVACPDSPRLFRKT